MYVKFLTSKKKSKIHSIFVSKKQTVLHLKNPRVTYFFLLLLVIILGILSRKISVVPLFMGDLLYAVMIFIFIRIFLIEYKSFQIAVLALVTCYTIECLQLYQADWILELRKTLFGRYVLGQGFLWSDLVAYSFGVLIAFLIEKK